MPPLSPNAPVETCFHTSAVLCMSSTSTACTFDGESSSAPNESASNGPIARPSAHAGVSPVYLSVAV